MHLPEFLAAPRLCQLGGQSFWVRPMSLAGWATVIAWLDDVLPGKADREYPPALSDEASQAALRSLPGRTLLAWLALRHEDVTYELARELWANANDVEQVRFLDVLTHRRRTLDAAPGVGTDLGESWIGEEMAGLADQIGIEAVGRLTLDQWEWVMSGGKCDGHASPAARGYARAMEIYREAQAQEADEVASRAPDPATRPEDLMFVGGI